MSVARLKEVASAVGSKNFDFLVGWLTLVSDMGLRFRGSKVWF